MGLSEDLELPLPAFVTLEGFARMLDELPALRQLHLDGRRDPLLHPLFFDMVSYAAARGGMR